VPVGVSTPVIVTPIVTVWPWTAPDGLPVTCTVGVALTTVTL
jgi:hypothetical protein